MASPFKTLEQRANSAVHRHLANADATATTIHGELVQMQVIFDDASEAALGGFVESTQPSALARSADVVDLRHGSPVDIGDVAYVVSGTQPDGTGMTRLILELAPA